MLYLITGANGAGKTLNTLKWVRERSVKESRPVCHNGRFEAVEGGELESWKKIDMTKWQDEPDGTIFLVDECHNDFPLRPPSGTPPEHVRMLAEHRRRGFDFYLVTQHPQNIDSFVRRLIGSPGWHRHLKRTFGADLVSCLEWAAVNPNCEKDGSGKTGTATMIPFPKEVYTWYRSASLHTGKKKIPWRVWLFLGALVLVPVLAYFAVTKVYGNTTRHGNPQGTTGQPGTPGQAPKPPGKMTSREYLADRVARLPDFPHTAPAYDEVTKPTVAPYPAACVQMGDRCSCYTQQATVMHVKHDTCLQIVQRGFFVDWQQPQQARATPAAPPQQTASQARSVPVPDALPPPDPTQMTQADVTAGLRLKNPAYAKLGGGGL